MGFSPYYVLPGVDGEFIDEAPEILMKKRKYNKVDIIQGITRDDGGLDLMYDYLYPTRREKINKEFEKLGIFSLYLQKETNSSQLARRVYQYYLQRENITVTKKDEKKLLEMTTDSMFRVSNDIVANMFAPDPNIKLYTYQLDHEGQISFMGLIPGVNRTDIITHADDLIYLFYGSGGFLRKLENQDDLKVREIFLDLWTNFAKTGNPTPSGSDFIWKEATPKFSVFDTSL
ncbi:Liver carboxylesterase 1 [Armadillidium nasatum]|uniref:Liver carboxylesterase 1 n=1 Tax=Armadillidium nasatum TaxID=96803 RepID=A0A5N5TP07_9CRUS|nr:Liver carboxylesterase 1 [Armadillidium nasatum]